jgi:hypothetical protein
MRQGFQSNHFTDEQNRPAGGTTFGVGFAIGWQHGPLGRGQDRKAPNGAFVEDIIDAARDRIGFYQLAAGGRFACPENAEAIQHLTAALEILDSRTREREARQVEGTHQP